MALLNELAEGLAKDALDLAARLGDDDVVDEISKLIGSTSTTLEEEFLTAIRLMRAERRARGLLESIAARGKVGSSETIELGDVSVNDD